MCKLGLWDLGWQDAEARDRQVQTSACFSWQYIQEFLKHKIGKIIYIHVPMFNSGINQMDKNITIKRWLHIYRQSGNWIQQGRSTQYRIYGQTDNLNSIFRLQIFTLVFVRGVIPSKKTSWSSVKNIKIFGRRPCATENNLTSKTASYSHLSSLF